MGKVLSLRFTYLFAVFLELQTTEKVINIRLKKSTIEVYVMEVSAKRKGFKREEQDEKKEEKKYLLSTYFVTWHLHIFSHVIHTASLNSRYNCYEFVFLAISLIWQATF